jgi:hypothetical protein
MARALESLRTDLLKVSTGERAGFASVGRAKERVTVQREVMAARVAAVTNVSHDLSGHFLTLVEIHAAPEWLWSAPRRFLCARRAPPLKSERTWRHRGRPHARSLPNMPLSLTTEEMDLLLTLAAPIEQR